METNLHSFSASDIGQRQAGKPTADVQTRKPSLRRSTLEIRMDMLKAIVHGSAGPTQIMYGANLSWLVLQENLRSLLSAGLLGCELQGNRQRYQLTSKGLQLLNSFSLIEKELAGERDQLKAPAY